MEQNKLKSSYQKDESWLILSSIEQSIKNKIESIGTPLKDWNIQINRGILTGCNEAFIIDENKRIELIEKDPKSAEIIRPILRGRDIKKYGYEFKNLYLICTFPSKHYNINDYPAIKDHLLSFDKRKLEQSGQKNIDGIKGNNARKKTNNKWFETQDSISYWDDFNKPKIVFSRISGDTPCFALDNNRCMVNDTAYIITGDNIKYLLDRLCSPEYWFAFRRFYMGGGIEKEFKVNNLKNLPIPFPNSKPLELSEIERKYIYSFQN
ncbi:TaqI-like C-terminal specificity domain-containing protein [Limosilactobacillus mucosae]